MGKDLIAVAFDVLAELDADCGTAYPEIRAEAFAEESLVDVVAAGLRCRHSV